ncbi:hypothetical protein ACP4OV_008281 [Aristida adscensionis]
MSPSKKRRRVCTRGGATRPPSSNASPPSIPDDLLVEIFARADGKAVVRGAATCKAIRRAVAGPDFRRRLALRDMRATAGGGDGGFGFDAGLLHGVSYFGWDSRDLAPETRHPHLRINPDWLRSYEAVASRGSLVVLRQLNRFSAELRVVNSLTGDVTRVPAPTHSARYPRVLLAAGDAGGRPSFRLLVAGRHLVTQTFSPEHGGWGGAVAAHLPPRFPCTVPNRGSLPLVLGGAVVHWLCKDRGIVALDTRTARATVIGLPPRCFGQVIAGKGADKGLLAASPEGRLSLLVAEFTAISMWTLSEAPAADDDDDDDDGASSMAPARWTWQVVIRREGIGREGPESVVRFLGFGERSGAVALYVDEVGLVLVNLGSREVAVLTQEFRKRDGNCSGSTLRLCLHEMDLYSLIRGIKPF